jgi:hypothetical protein
MWWKKCYISIVALDHKWEIPIVYNRKSLGNRLAVITAQNLACWCKVIEDSTRSLSLLIGTKVFMLTPIDEKATPLSKMLRGLSIAKYYTWHCLEKVVCLKFPGPHNSHVVLPYLNIAKKKELDLLSQFSMTTFTQTQTC